MHKLEQVELLDVTSRDGNNAIDFQFSQETTHGILSGLDEAGIHFIEIGHGYGVGASEKSGKRAKLSDEECEIIAKNTLRKAHWKFKDTDEVVFLF